MLHLLKKLKLKTKLSPERVHKAPISIQIKIHLWSFVDYQQLQKYFYNWNITLNYCFIYKSISGLTLSGDAPFSIKCPYFDNITLPTCFELFFYWKNKFLSICSPVVTRSQIRNVFFSEILTHTTEGFFHKKNVGLWLEFASFWSWCNMQMIIVQMLA